MTFEWPIALASVAAVPAAVFAYLVLDRNRRHTTARWATPALMPNMVAGAPGRIRHLPAAIALVALAAMLIALARPHATLAVPREEATVVLAIDVSRSMTATDVAPTRLTAAQAAARRFLERVPDRFRVGVVAFATRATAVAPATEDREAVNAALAALRPGEGTAIGEAIILSLQVAAQVPGEDAEGRPPASILLLSDGAQTQGDVTPPQAAAQARRAGIPVYTVALGTDEGVVERQLEGGAIERIRVPPDPQTLRTVAGTTGAEFFAARDDERLTKVYEELGSRLGHRDERKEVTVAFAGGAGALLLVAGTLSMLLFRRLP
jgi:Ca-activated chloride channel family protein